jgi:hypothetical protein
MHFGPRGLILPEADGFSPRPACQTIRDLFSISFLADSFHYLSFHHSKLQSVLTLHMSRDQILDYALKELTSFWLVRAFGSGNSRV